MTFKVFAPQTKELKPRIVVFGVGGAGGNAVNNMIEAGLEGVEFVVANTDAQQLAFSKTDKRIQLGVQTTQGLGAGAHPDVGMTAAEESTGEIGEHLDGAHMVFITAGMGGGTGTGAGPIIAKCARERGILTVGVVTKPFHFEGRHRMRLADAGIAELQRYVDTLIVIPNQNLFRVANERTTFAEAFGMADQVLHSGVRSITDLMVLPGLINLDFADVRTVMTEMGKAMMGTGEASGEGRALMAAENAIQNPLLDEVSLKGAKAVLVNITGGLDMTLLEVDEAANAISGQVDADANIIFGAAFDPALQNTLRVSVVATGMDGASIAAIEPSYQRTVTRAPEPVYAPEPAPIAAYVEPEPEPVVAMAEPEPAAVEVIEHTVVASQPKVFEPLRATAYTSAPARRRRAARPGLQRRHRDVRGTGRGPAWSRCGPSRSRRSSTRSWPTKRTTNRCSPATTMPTTGASPRAASSACSAAVRATTSPPPRPAPRCRRAGAGPSRRCRSSRNPRPSRPRIWKSPPSCGGWPTNVSVPVSVTVPA